MRAGDEEVGWVEGHETLRCTSMNLAASVFEFHPGVEELEEPALGLVQPSYVGDIDRACFGVWVRLPEGIAIPLGIQLFGVNGPCSGSSVRCHRT